MCWWLHCPPSRPSTALPLDAGCGLHKGAERELSTARLGAVRVFSSQRGVSKSTKIRWFSGSNTMNWMSSVGHPPASQAPTTAPKSSKRSEPKPWNHPSPMGIYGNLVYFEPISFPGFLKKLLKPKNFVQPMDSPVKKQISLPGWSQWKLHGSNFKLWCQIPCWLGILVYEINQMWWLEKWYFFEP